MKMTVFWDVALCNLVEIDRCSTAAYFLLLQGPDDVGRKHL
jgi:hypothetical protein